MIGKLKQGQVIKNYKELCKLLDVDVKGGKGKQYQMKEIERYYKFRKEGYKFIIEQVYPEPKPKIDNRVNNGGNNTKYEDLMDKLIINMLIEYEYIEESFSGIMDLLDFFTAKYVNLNKAGYKKFAEINNIGVGVTLTYQQKLNNIVKKCLETSLNRLQRDGIIIYEKRINIRDKDFNEHLADVGMEILINKYENEVYEEMKIKHYNRILLDVNRRFKNKVSEKLDIMSYWNIYCIELVDKDTKPVEEDIDELKRRLIQSVVEAVKNKKSKDNFGNVFRPYNYEKYQSQLDKLTKLLWKLPQNYTTETDVEDLMSGNENCFGEPNPFNKQIDYETGEIIDFDIDIDEYNEFCTTNTTNIDNIPF